MYEKARQKVHKSKTPQSAIIKIEKEGRIEKWE
jgi:hypothetical protein